MERRRKRWEGMAGELVLERWEGAVPKAERTAEFEGALQVHGISISPGAGPPRPLTGAISLRSS